MSLKIAIVGRPNVGKSTLFNRLVGKKLAIVHDTPGVTRDRREGEGSIRDLKFTVIDTAGLEIGDEGSIEFGMWEQTRKAVLEADLCLMMIDARAGVHPYDEHFADIIRKSQKPVILLANKCEGKAGEAGLYESYKLGLGDPIAISSEHGDGIWDLYYTLKKQEKELFLDMQEDEVDEDLDSDEEERPISLAIVGRPNVGKSTLVNALIEDERMLTGDIAGLTRDAISVDWEWQGKKIKLVDTAGLRKHSKVKEDLEKMSVANTKRAAFMAQVVVLVLDADAVLDKQDLTIASQVIEEGRALIIAVNKWDAALDKTKAINRLNDRLETSLTQVAGIPTITISALKKKGLDKLMQEVLEIYRKWNVRISTGKLNRWFEFAIEKFPPPSGQHGKRIKLKYITQGKTRPPSFYIFSSNPEGLPDSYLRYLTNSLRDNFNLAGVPIRITTRKNENPYEDKRNKYHVKH